MKTSKKRGKARPAATEREGKRRLEMALEEGLRETFPASDAVAVTEPAARSPRRDVARSEPGAVAAPTGIRDLLLPLISYPVPTTQRTIDDALRLAKSLGARISALSFELDIRSPVGLYADVLNVSGMLAAERKKSSAKARELLSAFGAAAVRRDVPNEGHIEQCTPVELAHRLTEKARLCDLTLFPIDRRDGSQQGVAEQIVFDSGRPVILFPAEPERELSAPLRNIAIAWDFSRPAARAVADALPLLRSATAVRIFTVMDDKPIKESGSGAALSRHLAVHGIEAAFEEVTSDGRSTGEVFESYVRQRDIDLLVMGAYGHSRLKEFILGGATRSILAVPPTWVLLSH